MMKLRHTELSIPAAQIWLSAQLAHAPDCLGLIVVAQNAVDHHLDSREAYFAQRLQEAGFATLLFDLLTHHEETRDPDARYNTALLGQRLGALFEWLRHQPPLVKLPLGLVVSSTGCAAAARAVAREPQVVDALVFRGGRPDLAGITPLRQISCPTLVLAGERDGGLANLRQAYDLIEARKAWRSLAGTDDAFREPGALDNAARLSSKWFLAHLLPQTGQATFEDERPARSAQ